MTKTLNKKISLKSRILMGTLIVTTAAGITAAGIIYSQKLFKMLPLYISLSVMLFQSNASRLAPLIGGLNSILYAIVDYSYGLYASALSDILFSCTIQLATFVLWTKRKDGATTLFRKMTLRKRILLFAVIVAVYIPALIVNLNIGATLAPLDAYLLVGAFATQMLTLFAFIEFTYLSVFGNLITTLMNALMLSSSPDRLCYLIFSIYSTICGIRGVITVRRIYKEQNTSRQAN